MKDKIARALVYALGLILLALGLVLNTKTGLGSAPLVSIAHCVSQLTGVAFANTAFVEYGAFVLIEIALHLIRRERKRLVNDALQLPFALVFTRFMGLFDRAVAPLPADASLVPRLGLLTVAILLIGVGACLSIRMRLIPNPGDGVVLAISDAAGWKLGVTKNAFDLANVAVACVIGLVARGRLLGVGIGTAACMLGVGRVIDLTGRLLAPMIERLAPKPKAHAPEG